MACVFVDVDDRLCGDDALKDEDELMGRDAMEDVIGARAAVVSNVWLTRMSIAPVRMG